MRSSTIQALIADLENENIEPLTDTPGVGQARFAAVGPATTVHELGWQLRWGDAGAIMAIKPWWMGPDSIGPCGVAPPMVS